MRSVVVVLPASMCAMMPMLRVFSSDPVLAMSLIPVSHFAHRKGPFRAPCSVSCSPGASYVVEVSIALKRRQPAVRRVLGGAGLGAEAVPEAANDASRGPALAQAPERRFWGSDAGCGPVRLAAARADGVAARLLVIADFSTISYRTIGIGRVQQPRRSRGLLDGRPCPARLRAGDPGWAGVRDGSRSGRRPQPGGGAGGVRDRGRGAGHLGIASDYPTRDDQRGLDARYSDVTGHLGSAFKLELVGRVLLVLTGGLALVRPGAGAAGEPAEGGYKGAGGGGRGAFPRDGSVMRGPRDRGDPQGLTSFKAGGVFCGPFCRGEVRGGGGRGITRYQEIADRPPDMFASLGDSRPIRPGARPFARSSWRGATEPSSLRRRVRACA